VVYYLLKLNNLTEKANCLRGQDAKPLVRRVEIRKDSRVVEVDDEERISYKSPFLSGMGFFCERAATTEKL
jgi:hypothetical protein